MKILKISLLTSLVLYLLGNALTFYRYNSVMEKVNSFDTDQNGFIDDEEITIEAKKAVHEASRSRHPKLAPIIIIPYALIFGLITFIFLKSLEFLKRKLINF